MLQLLDQWNHEIEQKQYSRIAGLVGEVVRQVWAKEITGHAAIEAKFAEIRRLSDSGLQ